MPLSVTYQMIRDAAGAAKAEAEKLKNQPLLAAIIQLQGFAFELQAENETLRRERDREASLTFQDGVYWSDDPRNPGPFCPTCWGRERKLIPLQLWHCYACETNVPEPGRVAHEQPADFPPPRDPV